MFDPPLASGQGLDDTQLSYTHTDTGNPYRVRMTWSVVSMDWSKRHEPRQFDDRPIKYENIQLLNQQLDASIHYKFAIVSGPTSTSEVIIGDQQNASYRSSPNPCNFTSVQMWRW